MQDLDHLAEMASFKETQLLQVLRAQRRVIQAQAEALKATQELVKAQEYLTKVVRASNVA